MSAAEAMVTAETEETLRVMAHIRDLNRSVAEWALRVNDVSVSDSSVQQTIERLEALPFLLCEFRFTDEAYWRSCIRAVPCCADDTGTDANAQLARHVLSVAWHCGRVGTGPRLLLGIGRGVGLLITTLRFAQIEAIAEARKHDLRQRWAEVPGFWPQLLETACGGSEERWSRFQVHALRLLGRDCV